MNRDAAAAAVALILGVGVSLIGAAGASAQPAPPGPVVVSSNSGTPLLVDGLTPDKLPVSEGIGTQICIPAPRVYVSEGERWIFQNWSTGSTDQCVNADRAGEYRALYSHEVLLVVRSEVAETQRSMWAAYGVPVSLDVPPLVQDGDNTRHRFQSWSDGETPFNHSNTIAPVKPITVEVKWVREHQIIVEAPDGANVRGSGWYADGSNLVLRAPDTLPGVTDQDRLKFIGWEGDSFPAAVIQNPQQPLAALKVDAPYTLRALFTRQYLVDASSPFGTLKHDWVSDGDSVVLEAPATSEIIPDQSRLVFKRWDGMDGLLSPRITGKVDRPIIVTATYEKQVMLKIAAPHGAAGEGWQKVGDVVPVSVPGSVSQMFLLNSTFTGFAGYPAGQSSVQVLINEPTTLTALYRTEPNLMVLASILLLPLLAVIVYFSVTRGWYARIRERLHALRVSGWRHPAAVIGNRPLQASARVAGRNGTHLSLPVGEEQR
jgi:hypothetical protein